MPAPIITSLAEPFSPTLETPILPPSPTVEDFRMAKEIEMAKCEQAQKRLRILEEQLGQMNSACEQSIENIQHSGGEVKHAQDASKAPPASKQSGSSASAPPMKRKSSLNGAAAPFVPTSAKSGNSAASSNAGSS
ncbi:hypothetical protein GTA08_BOTSDO13268 [Botryosphaeria dothidea]|uniref:Uncharacterized protein n=1 Tax=Botryosphaeria dothidea TaxID=55169 RepID=A0A8H4NDG8_9PEZI|nr:hypothetical protein GTA08_BOTSDO13268 [Botryosphaeria dothidea]